MTITGHGNDRYGRLLANVAVGKDDVAHGLVADGMAWHYVRYSKDSGLAVAEREARAAGRGLWADKVPVPPWEWRATQRERKAQKRQPAAR